MTSDNSHSVICAGNSITGYVHMVAAVYRDTDTGKYYLEVVMEFWRQNVAVPYIFLHARWLKEYNAKPDCASWNNEGVPLDCYFDAFWFGDYCDFSGMTCLASAVGGA